MKYGLAVFPTMSGLPPAELARLAEDRQFESIFFPEHSHMPLVYKPPDWDESGAGVGPEYARTLDPFVALTAAACATTHLNVGTGICLVSQRDPIQTAKAVATLDALSHGRFIFGIGAGWNREEMANHGYAFETRFARMREAVLAMKAIWTEDVATFEGQHFSFDRIESWPKPAQSPHPPILVGGGGPKVLDRVLKYGNEWLAEPERGLERRVTRLFEMAAEQRRHMAVTLYGADPDDCDSWASVGVQRCVFWLTPGDADTQQREIDDLARRCLSAQPDRSA